MSLLLIRNLVIKLVYYSVDLYVLCLGVIHQILHNADCAFIINVDFGIHEIETIVQHLISDPQYCPQQLIFSFLLLEVCPQIVTLLSKLSGQKMFL
ncbi:hypothetical protein Tco_0785737 [Tanacetum coccineum]